MSEPKICVRHNLPRIWGIKIGKTLYTYCTKCMDEWWEKEFAKEREERKRFAHLIPFKLWLLENSSYNNAVKRFQAAKRIERDTGKKLGIVSYNELNELYGHLSMYYRNSVYLKVKKDYERWLKI